MSVCPAEGVVLQAEKPVRELQMMLAMGAPSENLAGLAQLCRQWIQLGHACRWEARLYSKDPRVGDLWPVKSFFPQPPSLFIIDIPCQSPLLSSREIADVVLRNN